MQSILSKPIPFQLASFAVILLLLATAAQAKILFRADFECGETQTAHKLKPGTKTIELIPNFRLDEWDKKGGEGIVEGNLPEAAEAFKYDRREGVKLKGVTGIRKSHAKCADIRTGNLNEWLGRNANAHVTGRAHMDVTMTNPLGGNYSLEFDASNAGTSLRRSIMPRKERYFARFCVRFSKAILQRTDTYLSLCFMACDSISLQHLLLRPPDRHGPARFLLEGGERIHLKEEVYAPKQIAIHPNQTYCVEYAARIIDSRRSEIDVFVNGAMQLRQRVRYTKGNRTPRHTFFLGRLGTQSPEGVFTVDNVMISGSPIGPMPARPGLRLDKGWLCRTVTAAEKTNRPFAAQWQVASENTWMLPAFNSGLDRRNTDRLQIPYVLELSDSINEIDYLPTPIGIATGIQTGEEYFARVRTQTSMGFWSEWSTPLRFKAPDQRPKSSETNGLPEIQRAFFCETGRTRPLKRLVRGRWYDFYLYVQDPAGWSNLSYADVCLSNEPQHCLVNYMNRGGAFDPCRNYPLSFALNRSWAYVRQRESSTENTGMRGKLGAFFDDSKGQYLQNAEKGWIRSRMRLLDSACIGPWVITSYAKNKQLKFSRMFGQIIQVVETGDSRSTRSLPTPPMWLWLALAAGIVIAFAALGTAIHMARSLRALIPKPASESKPGLADYSSHVRKAIDFIRENCGRDLSPKDVAESLHITSGYLGKMFAKETGDTVVHHINRTRIDKAKELLTHKDLSIATIAFQVGFKDEFYFSRVFRQFESKSPMDFRKSIT